MGIFGSTKPGQRAAEGDGRPLSDVEQPGAAAGQLKTAASAPEQQPSGSSTSATAAAPAGYRIASAPPAAGLASGPSQFDTLTEEQRATLQHIERLTKVMDNCITIPLINKRVGLDAFIGLIPYAGDVTGGAVGTYIISRALKYNLPKRLVMRMLINQAIDSCVGVIPFVGDLFDFGFKANTRNMKLLQKHLERPKSAKRADTCFLFSLFILVVVVPMLLVVAIIGAIVLGILAALGKLR